MLPLVVYKLTAGSVSLWGFAGISYVTFKALQVVFEVHDGLIGRDELGLLDYLSFLLFFPQFTSGPIDRSRRFLADAHRVPARDEYAGMLARGILLLLAGMVYKLVIAQVVQRWWVLEPWGDGPWLAELANQVRIAYAYAAYLFFDFAGYSLMAMGASYCLGIRCPRNFRAPFLASDVIDFWNRWHITLSTWFRDFVFMRLTRALMRCGRRRGWGGVCGGHARHGVLARTHARLPELRPLPRGPSRRQRVAPEALRVLSRAPARPLDAHPHVVRDATAGDAGLCDLLRPDFLSREGSLIDMADGDATVRERVLDLLVDVCGDDAVRDHLDDDLFELGLLDSMGAIELLVGIEDELGVSIAPTAVPREQMNTPNKIVEQVEKRVA